MKYILIAASFNSEKGGIQTWSHNTANYLAARNIPFTCYDRSKASIFDALKMNLQSVFSRSDLILTDWHRIVDILPVVTMVKIRLKKSRIFIFFHGDELLNMSLAKKILFRYFINNKRVFPVCNSNATANLLGSISRNMNTSVCHPFLDFSEQQVGNSRFSAKKRVRVFLTVTRLAPRKNVINVLHALKRVKEDGNIPFHYYIAGTGPEEKEIRDLISYLGMEKSVTMLGFIDEELKHQLMSQSHLFILPSLYVRGSIEGYGIVFIEANYHGVPVLSGNSGGMLESVLDGVTGFHTDGTVNDIYLKIKLFTGTRFDKNAIVDFAMKHDIHSDDTLMRILSGEKGLNLT